MSFETMANTARTRFVDEVETPLSIYVHYDNAPITDGAGNVLSPEPEVGAKWIKYQFLPGDTDHIQNGGPTQTYRTVGIIKAIVFTFLEEGDQPGLELADDVVEKFRSVSVDNMTFRSPNVVPVGRAGPWWRTDVDIPFLADVQA